MVNEIVDLAKRRKDECLLFKVDFEKAYDSIAWSYLVYMIEHTRFDKNLDGVDGSMYLCKFNLCTC